MKQKSNFRNRLKKLLYTSPYSPTVIASYVLFTLGFTCAITGYLIFDRGYRVVLPEIFVDLLIEIAPILISASILIPVLNFWVDSKLESREIEKILFDIKSIDNQTVDHALRKARQIGILDSGFLKNSNLRNINFENVDVSNLDFSGSDLDNANFYCCILTFSNLSRVEGESVNFKRADLRQASFQKSKLLSADFTEADLSYSSLVGCAMQTSTFDQALGINAEFQMSELSLCSFNRTKLPEANFSEADLRGANFSEADLQGADFRRANLQDVDFSRARLSGANLRDATLKSTIFDNIRYDENTIWPDNFDVSQI